MLSWIVWSVALLGVYLIAGIPASFVFGLMRGVVARSQLLDQETVNSRVTLLIAVLLWPVALGICLLTLVSALVGQLHESAAKYGTKLIRPIPDESLPWINLWDMASAMPPTNPVTRVVSEAINTTDCNGCGTPGQPWLTDPIGYYCKTCHDTIRALGRPVEDQRKEGK